MRRRGEQRAYEIAEKRAEHRAEEIQEGAEV
jgi:hypothetical protein